MFWNEPTIFQMNVEPTLKDSEIMKENETRQDFHCFPNPCSIYFVSQEVRNTETHTEGSTCLYALSDLCFP